MNSLHPASCPALSRAPARFLRHAATALATAAAAFALAGCAPSGTDAATGQKLFAQCAQCHAIGPNARAGYAPELNNLFGRRAGATPDFAYSAAMKASGITWNERTLAAFLHDPDKLVPGTKMSFWGIGDDRQIAALLAYLRSFQDTPAGNIPQNTALH